MARLIQEVMGDAPVSCAAAIVLRSTLAQVRKAARRALRRSAVHVEDVHQLRVATRRANAAVRIFEEQLAPRTSKKLRRGLKRMRQRAAASRDMTVLELNLLGVQGSLSVYERLAIDALVTRWRRRRPKANRMLRRTLKRFEQKGFWKWTERVLDRLERKPRRTANANGAPKVLMDLARDVLPRRWQELLAAAPMTPNCRWEQLHELRIAGKALRYSLELLAGCFPPERTSMLYDAVRKLQDALGSLNDDYNVWRELRRRTAEADAELEAGFRLLEQFYAARIADDRDQFFAFWNQAFDTKRCLTPFLVKGRCRPEPSTALPPASALSQGTRDPS